MIDKLKNFIVVSGHYGCGKTNLSLNLAFDHVKAGHKVTIVDMDLVNPYFRTSDYRDILEAKGIEVIAPVFGHTNLDIPSLPASMYSIFESRDVVIVDVGGDDVGSTVLGRFKKKFDDVDYDMIYVVNCFRNMTSEPSEAVEILREIEQVSGLKANMIVNNSHLMYETDASVFSKGIDFAKKVSESTGLKLIASTVEKSHLDAFEALAGDCPVYPIDIYVKAPL